MKGTKEMVKQLTKLDILRWHFNEGKAIKEIARELKISKNTVKKYIREFENQKEELKDTNIPDSEIVELMLEKPKYDSTNRKKRVLTDEIIKQIDEYLEENEFKKQNRLGKQILKAVDIHEELEAQGYKLSYTTVAQYVAKHNKKHKEAFIKQVYEYGEICEFDWGEIKVYLNEELVRYRMAVFTLAKSNLRYAKLYRTEDNQSFVDAHINFFQYVGGVPKIMVYDNMKVAVKKFVGPTEKEATEALKKLAIYYGFNYRFCNAYSGNEKGHVENSVEFVRRKSFASKYKFTNHDEAEKRLNETIERINKKNEEEIDKEKETLLALMPTYEAAIMVNLRVDKLSTIVYKQNKYSVPDYLVGKYVNVKITVNRINIYFNNNLVASHEKSYKNQTWSMNIEHYRNTLLKKPGAIKNSLAFSQLNTKLQSIFNKYFLSNPKEFIELLDIVSEYGIEKAENTIEKLNQKHIKVNLDNVKIILNNTMDNDTTNYKIVNTEIEKKSKEQLLKYDNLFKTQDIRQEAVAI